MKKFRYTHTDDQGNRSEGTLEAKSKPEAMTQLSQRGLVVTSLDEVTVFSNPKLQSAVRIIGMCLLLSLLAGAGYFFATRQIDQETGSRVLVEAIEKNDQAKVNQLVKSEPALMSIATLRGDYPLHIAVGQDKPELARALLEAGARKEAKDKKGATPLLWAIEIDSPEMVKLLLDAGADKSAQDSEGNTILHYAAILDNAEMNELIFGLELDPNSLNQDGESPLHRAASEDALSFAEELLKLEADSTIQDKTGRTALHHAAEAGHLAMIQLLLKSQVDKATKDTDGNTAYDLAAQEGYQDIKDLLR